MQVVVADATLRSRLGNLANEFEVRDELGQLLGRYVPVSECPAPTQVFPFTEEDLDRARGEPGGKTLAAIWQALGRTS